MNKDRKTERFSNVKISQKFEFPNKIINRLLLTWSDPHNGETARLHLRFNIVSNFQQNLSRCFTWLLPASLTSATTKPAILAALPRLTKASSPPPRTTTFFCPALSQAATTCDCSSIPSL